MITGNEPISEKPPGEPDVLSYHGPTPVFRSIVRTVIYERRGEALNITTPTMPVTRQIVVCSVMLKSLRGEVRKILLLEALR